MILSKQNVAVLNFIWTKRVFNDCCYRCVARYVEWKL